MSTQPLGIRVICDAKRSASCRDYIETGALQIYNARIIARHEGWDTTPEVPRRDICPACMRGKQLLDQDVALVAMFERTDRIRCDIDNLVKAVTDAIQSTRASKSHMGRIGPVLRDDSQIVDMRVRLVRGASTDGTTVAILATEGDPS